MYAQVAVLSPPYATLTYSLPALFPAAFWRQGLRVAVPLGPKSLRTGIVLAVFQSRPEAAPHVCKDIFWPLESAPLLNGDTVAMVLDLAARQGIPPGQIWGATLPLGLRSTLARIAAPDMGKIEFRAIGALARADQERLAAAFIAGKASIAAHDQEKICCVLKVDPPWPVRPQALRQREVLDFLHEHGSAPRDFLLKKLGASAGAALRNLVARGAVSLAEAAEETPESSLLPPEPGSFELSGPQADAVAVLKADLASPQARFRLLHGVTGSGKTAVYMEAIRACLAGGENALLLAPEVALAHKLYRDFSRAGMPVFIFHGYQTARTRELSYRLLAARGEPFLLIGTRSALFLPLRQLGLIIIDEEHDASFKQDENFSYAAKELAWYRMSRRGGLLVLGSATPDVRTFFASETGAIQRLELPARVTGHMLPPAELVNIAGYSGIGDAENRGILAKETEEALLGCLERGEQAVILLNRRGYAPMMYCLDCGKTLRCPHCAIGLAYHKGIQRLVCHYCGYSVPQPSPCPQCGKTNLLAIGEGTERVAERLEALAGRPVLRLDRDSARRAGRLEEILTAFADNESPFLTGTQMLSKGHHFPNVTLVVVADGDIGLNLPDYRASEKTFQLLVQAAGRAGRGARPGRVLIQTRDPGHYCWQFVQNYDYRGFYQAELARRARRRYPPYTHLALLRLSWPQEDAVAAQTLSELASALKKFCAQGRTTLLGPAPAPIALLRGRRRYHCLLKSDSWNDIRSAYFFAKGLKYSSNFRIFLDMDPVNML